MLVPASDTGRSTRHQRRVRVLTQVRSLGASVVRIPNPLRSDRPRCVGPTRAIRLLERPEHFLIKGALIG